MSWSYTGNPKDSDKDAVRFLIGDTDPETCLVQDEEIEWQLCETPEVRVASAFILDALAAKFSQQTDKKVGDLSESSSKKAAAFRARALDIRKSCPAEMFVGGLSKSAKGDLLTDSDRVQPLFTVGDDDHPGADRDQDRQDLQRDH